MSERHCWCEGPVREPSDVSDWLRYVTAHAPWQTEEELRKALLIALERANCELRGFCERCADDASIEVRP